MLELWRPPKGAGPPVGCLATTYTFHSELFDEQCLGRFLDLDAEPDREDLAYLVNRETALEGVYAGVLVDHAFAGVEHSLRWDVLPVRLPARIQHSKVSVLAWERHVRFIVASANLTEQGYRTNREIASVIDLTPGDADAAFANDVIGFVGGLINFVPQGDRPSEAALRARAFLDALPIRFEDWHAPARSQVVYRYFVSTFPRTTATPAISSLEGVLAQCKRWRALPTEVQVASPFFDASPTVCEPLTEVVRNLGRARARVVKIAVPVEQAATDKSPARLLAPRSLMAAVGAGTELSFLGLPASDLEANPRCWHAKMIQFSGGSYTAVMVGSSNFTSAGLGIRGSYNAEANVLMVTEDANARKQVARLWDGFAPINDPENAEWLGPADQGDDELPGPVLPVGFLSAAFDAATPRALIFSLNPDGLPPSWAIRIQGVTESLSRDSDDWIREGAPAEYRVPWNDPHPPTEVLVLVGRNAIRWSINAIDQRQLPAPAAIDEMSADDMLRVIASTDPSAALRVWASRRTRSETFNELLDSVSPLDLDPLKRYGLGATFLHRIRARARSLAALRGTLERPAHSRRALESRLRGIMGIEALANRYLGEWEREARPDDAVLAMSDLLLVLSEVLYSEGESGLTNREFRSVYQPFLHALARSLDERLAVVASGAGPESMAFWTRVVGRCAGD